MTTIHITEEEIEVRPSPERALAPLPLSTYQQGYQGGRNEEGEGGGQQQQGVALDILEQNIPESAKLFHNPELQQNLQRMAELVQARIQSLQVDANCVLIEMGYDYYWGKEFQLWRYIGIEGVNSMQDWEKHMGLKSTLKTEALALYSIWPTMRDLDYSLQKMLDGSITTGKAIAIQGVIRDFNRQEKARKPKREHLVEVEEIVEEGQWEEEHEEAPIIIDSVPPILDPEELASIVDVKAKIDRIINDEPGEVVKDDKARNKKPDPAKLSFRNIEIRPDGLATATVIFDPEEEQMRQMARGYILCVFPEGDGSEGYLVLQKAEQFGEVIDLLGEIIEDQANRHSHSHSYSQGKRKSKYSVEDESDI